MRWTPEQLEILEHPPDAHALVHAVPGAGKITTLVGRVERLCNGGVDPRRIRVVMFNKAIQETFSLRLVGAGIRGVHFTTFDALGLEVLRVAERQGKLSAPLEVVARRTHEWAKAVHRNFFRTIETSEDIADTVYFIAELSPPKPRPPARPPAGAASPERRKPWPPEEDAALTAGWIAREGLDSLAARFGRSTRAISARLVHLGVVGSRGDARKRG